MTAHKHAAVPRRQPVGMFVLTLISAGLVFVHPAAVLLCVTMILVVAHRLRSEPDPGARRLLCVGLVVLALTLATAAVLALVFAGLGLGLVDPWSPAG